MNVEKRDGCTYVIIHAGKEIDEDFNEEIDAWEWADKNIDDQVFDTPNRLSPPLKYRDITNVK